MRNLALAAILTVSLALAGCSGDGGGDGETTSSSSSSSRSSSSASSTASSSSSSATGSSSSSTSGAPGPNQPPSGSISAQVNGTNATFTLTGSDPDGDIVVWDLAFGDGSTANGTSLPAEVVHDYPSAGNFTANFTITDGTDPVTYDLVVPIAGADGPQGIVFIGEQTTPTSPVASLVIPNVGYAGGTACAGFVGGENGVDCVFFELEAGFEGKSFTATTDVGDPDLEFWPVCDASEVFAVAGFNNVGPESGVVPGGALCVVIWAKSPPDVPVHTFTVL
jgi:hypothetical protein